MVSRKEYDVANEAGQAQSSTTPKAMSAKYDRRIGRIVVQLKPNLGILFSPHDVEGLENATPPQLSEIEITPSGFGLHFPKLDADVYLPALLEGVFGSARWMASRLGARGGTAKSPAKSRAAQENGRRGGRPRRTATA